MRTKLIYSLAIIGLIGFGSGVLAQGVSLMPTASVIPSPMAGPTASPVLKSITPIIEYISDKELKQEIQIREINGLKVCEQFAKCPFEDLDKSYIEAIIKVGEVREISSDFLVVSVFSHNYQIDLTQAKLLRQSWGNSDLDEFSVGDLVNVFGYLDKDNEFLIYAKTVRNLSIQKAHQVIKGIVKTVNSDNSFIVQNLNGGETKIVVDDGTKIIIAQSIACIQIWGIVCPRAVSYETDFSVIEVDQPIIVRGMNSEQNNSILADLIIVGNDDHPFFKNIRDLQKQSQTSSNSILSKLKEKIDETTKLKEKIQELQNRIMDMMQQVRSKEGKAIN